MPATRKDVAALARVSPAVVSYVINGGPRPVSPELRERVLAAVQELRYRPDGLGRSLRTGTSNTIALMVPDASNPFFAQLARAIEDAAFGRGLAVLVCNSADDSVRETSYLKGLADRRIDGLIFISAVDEQDFSELIDLGIPVVAMDRALADTPVSTVRVDNEAAAYMGTMHLLRHGHRSPAFIGGPTGSVASERQSGWKLALSEQGMPLGRVVTAPFTYVGGKDAAVRMFDGSDQPTSVLVSSDAQAIGVVHALTRLGLAVPADVAVVSIDGTELADFTNPPLATVSQPISAMARSAVQHIIDLRGGSAPVHVEFEAAFLARGSCGCASNDEAGSANQL